MDDVLIYAIEDRDFSGCGFERAMLFEGFANEFEGEEFLLSECNITGTIDNFCSDMRKAPPLIDTFIVPGGAAQLYALFE